MLVTKKKKNIMSENINKWKMIMIQPNNEQL